MEALKVRLGLYSYERVVVKERERKCYLYWPTSAKNARTGMKGEGKMAAVEKCPLIV